MNISTPADAAWLASMEKPHRVLRVVSAVAMPRRLRRVLLCAPLHGRHRMACAETL